MRGTILFSERTIDRITTVEPSVQDAGDLFLSAADLSARQGIAYVDATVMMPTLKGSLGKPSGISRVGVQIVASGLLRASGSRLIVADRHARRLRAFVPDDRANEVALIQQMSGIAQSMRRPRLEDAWTRARTSLSRKPWRLPSELELAGERDFFLFYGMNIKRGFLESLKLARRRHGMRVALFLHDLLPLTHPHYFMRRGSNEYRRFLSRFLKSCDLVIASSRYTATAFPEAVAGIIDGAPPRIAVAPLAHEYRP